MQVLLDILKIVVRIPKPAISDGRTVFSPATPEIPQIPGLPGTGV